ncbi:unnamed protein product [Ilex paraguariensis]|uniref:RING-type domain-containing protein n=1 Tax=Ilex paraguariensis TaxID=185542 RepID=A0ABC8TGL6_9AQUA
MAVQAQFCSENMGLPLPICGSQDWLISSVLGIDDGACFQDSPQGATKLHQGFQLLGPNRNSAASSSSSGSAFLSMEFSQSLASELEKQSLDIDWYLHLQKEGLSRVLQEKTRQQQALLLHGFESKMMRLMWQKDEDIAVAKKKTMELQGCMIRAEMEAKVWQKKALEKEAIVLDLHNRLNQVKKRDCFFFHGVQDSESFCDSSNKGDKDQEGKEEQREKMLCKLCHARRSCVVFLPCRHLCSCKSCEAFLGLCPVCQSVKKGSIEVSLV